MKIPSASLTLFFSELTTDPWVASVAAARFRFEIPTTPRVFPVIGCCAWFPAVDGAAESGGTLGIGGAGADIPDRPLDDPLVSGTGLDAGCALC